MATMTPIRPALALATALLAPAVLFLAAPRANAQTLSEAMAQSYASNPALLAARANLRSVDENVPQALAGWRPTVSVSAAGGPIDSRVPALQTFQEPLDTPPFVSRFQRGTTAHIERQLFTSQLTV